MEILIKQMKMVRLKILVRNFISQFVANFYLSLKRKCVKCYVLHICCVGIILNVYKRLIPTTKVNISVGKKTNGVGWASQVLFEAFQHACYIVVYL